MALVCDHESNTANQNYAVLFVHSICFLPNQSVDITVHSIHTYKRTYSFQLSGRNSISSSVSQTNKQKVSQLNMKILVLPHTCSCMPAADYRFYFLRVSSQQLSPLGRPSSLSPVNSCQHHYHLWAFEQEGL